MSKRETLTLEINNRCNLFCNECAYKTLYSSTTTHELSVEQIRRILSLGKEYGFKRLRILGMAEPTLHSDFSNVINEIKKWSCFWTHIFTNGTTLCNPQVFNSLLYSDINLIEFSLDAFTIEKYHLIRSNRFDFDTIVNNIILFKKSLSKKSSEVAVSFVLHPESLNEVKMFKDFWAGKVDRVIFRKPHNFSNYSTSLLSQQNFHEHGKEHECEFLIKKSFVDCEMNVHLCKMDFENQFIIGNIAYNSFDEVYSSKEYYSKLNSQARILKCTYCSGCD